ncbi:MAG: glycosyltransferase family 4 protein [Candidatus Dormibacteraeota bacterium]|jgi:glycosyltransferase involved in cell wall biosynthesis|nr:glycosyltransferase family 4 protein [Candidatus Dormibacteraeota bacterium]
MRIALVAPPWFPIPPEGYGGIERVVYLLGKGLKQLGHDVTVFGRRGRVSRLRTVDLVRGDWSHRLLGPDHMVLWLDYMSRVYRTLRERNFDLVHEHNEAIGITFASMACRTAPTLVTMHGEVSPALLQLLKGADCSVGLVAISNAQKRTTNGLRWAGMVHNAVETDDIEGPFPPSRKEYLIQLARLNPEKGQHLAIQAARRLKLPLILAGKLDTNTESRRYFREKIEPHLGNGVRWIRDLRGRNKWRLLANAKAMLFPIQWEEPFGLAMAEAMVVGTPVLAFPRGAAPELVEDGVTGYIVRNVSEMVSAFKRVGDIDTELCAKLARERFSASVMARGYEEIYMKAVERRPEGSNI